MTRPRKTDWRAYFAGRYLTAAELPGDMTYMIAGVDEEEVEDPDTQRIRRKMVVYLDGQKPWIPCRTAAACVAAMHGDDPADWEGQPITLYRDPTVRVGRETVGGIRVRGAPGLGCRLKVTIRLPRRKPLVVDLIDTGPAQDPVPPVDLEVVLADNDLCLTDLDRWRASEDRPLVDELNAEQRAQLAQYLVAQPRLLDAIRALIPEEAS